MSLGRPVTFLSMMVGALAPLAAACSSPPPTAQTNDTGAEIAALDAPNGALNLAIKEAPAFADPEVEALPMMDDALVAQVAPASLAAAAAAVPGGIAYRVALGWGHLPLAHDRDATDVAATPARWSGSIGVDDGAIGLIRTIGFGASDHLEPMATTQTLSFRSQTDAYVGGVLLRVIFPPRGSSKLHFSTSLLATDIDLSTLAVRAGGIDRATDGVAGLGWFGFREDLCVRGFVLGRWVKDHPGLGRSFAVVSDESGAFLGYVRGGWGYAPARSGEVWFDKFIDAEGSSHGLAFGWYGGGFYRGVWAATGEHDVSALDVGTTEGLYSDGDETGDGRGVWLGRWSGPCLP